KPSTALRSISQTGTGLALAALKSGHASGAEQTMRAHSAEGAEPRPVDQIGRSKLARWFGVSSRSRRFVSEHRQRRRELDRKISDHSRRGLDWTNFFMADVQVGFSSFLAYYLADLSWNKQDVGLALTVGALAAVALQIPGGALADAVR